MIKSLYSGLAQLNFACKNIKGEGRGLGYIDIDVQRNAYGRQIESFEELLDIHLDNNRNGGKFKSIFIRAPKILNVGERVRILGKFKEDIVLVRDNNVMASTFHPELTGDLRIHKYFINMIKNIKGDS